MDTGFDISCKPSGGGRLLDGNEAFDALLCSVPSTLRRFAEVFDVVERAESLCALLVVVGLVGRTGIAGMTGITGRFLG